MSEGELGRADLELVSKPLSQLSEEDREVFDQWLKKASGADLYLLLYDARQRWRRPRRSSSITMAAIRETAAPDDNEE